MSGTPKAVPDPNSRLKWILIGLVVLVAVIVLSRPSTGGRPNDSPNQNASASDATLKTKMSQSIAEFDSIASQVAGNGTDLAVRDRVLFVGSLLDPTDTTGAEQLCRSIAAIANDADTAQPLDLAGVVILAGGEPAADC